MSRQLRESVRIITPTGDLHGHLFVGADGLPELEVPSVHKHTGIHAGPWRFSPAYFPVTWTLSSPTCGELYQAWLDIERIQRQLAVAQREADEIEGTPEPEDDLTAAKRHLALEEER